ncbi:MAG TPA: TolC family protein, partial [Verrucomicrobiae bacterium]
MRTFFAASFALVLLVANGQPAATDASLLETNGNVGSRLLRPLSLADVLDMALQQNSSVRKSSASLEATYGIVVQTRAIALPRLGVTSSYSANDENSTDQFKPKDSNATNAFIANAFEFANEHWSADIRVSQSIYEGGRINSALRTARLTREGALLNHQTVIADALRDVRIAYYDVLLAQQQIAVQEASVKLLQQELEETNKRYVAGTVPRFNVLRAEVEVANARPKLIRVRNAFRIAKDRLANLLGEKIPSGTDELPLELTDKLEAAPWNIRLSESILLALKQRTELEALRKAEALRTESITSAKSGYKPSVQVYAGYGVKSSQFSSDVDDELHGWEAGAQLSWNIFDGFLTKGRVQEAVGLHKRAQEELA